MKIFKELLIALGITVLGYGSIEYVTERYKNQIKKEIRIEQPSKPEKPLDDIYSEWKIIYKDLNKDGIEDLVYECRKEGIFSSYWDYFVRFGTGIRHPDKWATEYNPIGRFKKLDHITFHDVDNDGDLDVLISFSKSSLFKNFYVTYSIENTDGNFKKEARLFNKQEF